MTCRRLSQVTHAPAATEALGRRLGMLLQPGDLITLSGELGGGKTCFVRGVAAGAGCAANTPVSSPTFALLHIYSGSLPLYHFDLYRLNSLEDLDELGVAEYLAAAGACLIEWPERLGTALPPDRLEVDFTVLDEMERRIVFSARGRRGAQLLAALQTDEML